MTIDFQSIPIRTPRLIVEGCSVDSEIKRSKKHPATWEKKGASLYTVKNVETYRELRVFTNRLLKKIKTLGGHVFYVGVEKTAFVGNHNSNGLHKAVLRESITSSL